MIRRPPSSTRTDTLFPYTARFRSGIAPTIVEYLNDTPDAKTLDALLKKLKIEPRELMRRKEAPYRELGLDDPGLSRAALIAAMVEHPNLIERPIFGRGAKAALGRPPETGLVVLSEPECRAAGHRCINTFKSMVSPVH